MAQVTVKNITGQDVRELSLKDTLFALPSNDTLLHQVYVALSANLRQAIAHTKDRSERRGSGIKPWRQKGTGRARAGSVRSPLWRKGGVTFGPTKERNFSKNTNQKMRQKAVLIALGEKVRAGKLIVLDAFAYDVKKTKLFAATLQALGLRGRSVMIGLVGEEAGHGRMFRNVPRVDQTLVENLNVMQLLDREFVIFTVAGIERLTGRFAAWDKPKGK